MRTSRARSAGSDATQSGMPWLAPLAVSVSRDSRLSPLSPRVRRTSAGACASGDQNPAPVGIELQMGTP